MLDDLQARCRFNAALARLRNRPWLVFIGGEDKLRPETAGYNTLPRRLGFGIEQNQQIRKAAGMSI